MKHRPMLATRKANAKTAAERWRAQYFGGGKWRYEDRMRGIWERLVALGDNPNPDDVERIIGNTSWTECKCDQCGERKESVVMVGEPLDYDSRTASLCVSCLDEARAQMYL